MAGFEIGCVYTASGGHLVLAVSKLQVVRSRSGVLQLITPRDKKSYKLLKSISVESLCEAWTISLDELDKFTADQVMAGVPKPRIRGCRTPRRDTDYDSALYQKMRTVRLVSS